MKKFVLFTLIAAFVCGLVFAGPSSAEVQRYKAEVYKLVNTGDVADASTRITSGITYKVLATDSDTAETIYSDPVQTAKTNPVTTTVYNTQDRIDFYCDPTDSGDLQVDLLVVDTSGGFTVFVEDFLPTTRTVIIDERPNVMHHGVIWFAASDNTATDTGVDFLIDTMIHNVIVEVVTVDATETINVGTVDTAAGFISAQSVAVAGYFDPMAATLTAGSSETYVSTAGKVGSLLGSSVVGTDADKDTGTHLNWAHIVKTTGTDDDLYYTGSADSDTAAGYIHYYFTRMR